MNPVTVIYGLILNLTHRFAAGEISEERFLEASKEVWAHAAELHVTMAVLNMLHRSAIV